MYDIDYLYNQVNAQHTSCFPNAQNNRKRYQKSFIEKYVEITSESKIAEVGPGHVILMLQKAHSCKAMAFGLVSDKHKILLRDFGIGTEQYDANTEDFPSRWHGYFDCVLHLQVIEHLNRWPHEVLLDTVRLLKPGGKLILSTVNICRLSNRMRMIFGKSPLITPFLKTPYGINHIREYDLKEFQSLCAISGLRINVFEYWQYRFSGIRLFLMPLISIIPSLSTHMFFCLSK